jgi:hypothetical protein
VTFAELRAKLDGSDRAIALNPSQVALRLAKAVA